jgi:hypothetical protein
MKCYSISLIGKRGIDIIKHLARNDSSTPLPVYYYHITYKGETFKLGLFAKNNGVKSCKYLNSDISVYTDSSLVNKITADNEYVIECKGGGKYLFITNDFRTIGHSLNIIMTVIGRRAYVIDKNRRVENRRVEPLVKYNVETFDNKIVEYNGENDIAILQKIIIFMIYMAVLFGLMVGLYKNIQN